MAQILSGKEIAKEIKARVAEDVAMLDESGVKTTLEIVQATSDSSSESYVRSIKKACEGVGIECSVTNFGDNATEQELEDLLSKLADDSKVHGIILQTPLPRNINDRTLKELIPVEKDIDGASPTSAGLLSNNMECFAPATAQAVIEILKYYNISIASKNVVVIGRSNIVGKPVAQLLLNMDATVSVCHSKTTNLEEYTKNANIVVCAVGKPNFFTDKLSNQRQVVIDVGTNFDEKGKMIGDVDFTSVEPIVVSLSPVPGGVGPVTTAILLEHACESAKKTL